MNTLRKFFKAVLLVVLPVAVSGCINLNKITVTSAKIGSITPTGLKSVKGTAIVGVDNETSEFTLTDISGVVRRKGTQIGTFTADPVTVRAETGATYTVSGSFALGSNISILEVLSIAANPNYDDFSVDISFKIKTGGGSGKQIDLEDVPVKSLAKALKNK